MALHFNHMRDGAARRIAAAAASYLPDGEKVRCAFWGQNTPARGRQLLREWIRRRVRWLTIVATDEHIVVFRRGTLQDAKILEVLARYPIRTTPTGYREGWGEVSVGEDRYWTSALIATGDAKRFVEFASSRRSN